MHRLIRSFLAALGLLAGMAILMMAGSRPAAAQPGQDTGCLQPVTAPNPSPDTETSNITGLAASSPTDIWAVGSYTPHNSRSLTYTLHWDGNQWSAVDSPSPGAFANILTGVAAISPNDVWAAGWYGMAGTDSRTLAMHWDGTRWSTVDTPSSTSRVNQLTAVSGVSSNDMWAVGFTQPGGGVYQGLLFHWDGRAWSQVPGPALPTPTPAPTPWPGGDLAFSAYYGVYAAASNDVWAVGWGTNRTPLIVHWDGQAWSRTQVPDIGTESLLFSVKGLSAKDVWAVGQKDTQQGDPLVMHWNGTQWSEVPVPGQAHATDYFLTVAPVSASEVWAAGVVQSPSGPQSALAMRWDGQAWRSVDLRGGYSSRVHAVAALLGEVWIGGQSYATSNANVEALLVRHTDGPCPLPGCWSAFISPGARGFQLLKSVAGRSPDDVWAVGAGSDGDTPQTLTVHWDGTRWSQVASPALTTGSILYGVAVVSANDAWAVGAESSSLHKPQRTLILHWDGAAWSRVTSPNPAPDNINELDGVAAAAADDVWAVGYMQPDPGHIGGKQALMLHWDGQSWSQVALPALAGAQYSTLEGLAVLSSNDIWAVGAGPTTQALALHWNGTEWSRTAMPAVPGLLHGVSAAAPNNVWAVGNLYTDQGKIDALALHWDGSSWSVVPTPANTDPQFIEYYWLNAVVALGPNDVWAGGYMFLHRSPPDSLLWHWDGSRWAPAPSPLDDWGNQETEVNGLASVSGDLWLVGVHGQGTMLRYKPGGCVTPTPTPVKPLNPPVPVPGTGSHTFPETGKTVTGIFLKYWQEHGGLMQQGYPISEVIGEVSDLNGRLYTMQYFERAVFEYHPENKPPYDVLLSQLGTFEYRQRYPHGAPNQRPNTSVGSVLFKETGHRLGGVFLDYWQTHGGLMQQGYPISDEFTEVSPLNGKSYTVQYFERAVFEYHPENAGTPFAVLLSHLGRFRWEAKYGTNPPVLPTPAEIPGGQIVAGHYTFWLDGDGQVSRVNGYDLDSGRQFVVAESATNKTNLASDGRYVAWVQDCPPYCHRIELYDLQTGKQSEPYPPAGRQFSTLVLDGGNLYFEEYTQGRAGLYAYNITTGSETRVLGGGFAADQYFQPVVEDGVLLYSRIAGEGTPSAMWTLFARKLDGGQEVTIATSPTGFTGYHVSGDNIVWSVYPTTPPSQDTRDKAFAYNLRSGVRTALSAEPVHMPAIRGNLVAWSVHTISEFPPGALHGPIEAHDLQSGQTWTVVPDRSTEMQVLGIASGDRVVFVETEQAGSHRHVYVVAASPALRER